MRNWVAIVIAIAAFLVVLAVALYMDAYNAGFTEGKQAEWKRLKTPPVDAKIVEVTSEMEKGTRIRVEKRIAPYNGISRPGTELLAYDGSNQTISVSKGDVIEMSLDTTDNPGDMEGPERYVRERWIVPEDAFLLSHEDTINGILKAAVSTHFKGKTTVEVPVCMYTRKGKYKYQHLFTKKVNFVIK